MATPKSRPRDGYPGRALALILVVTVGLVALMFGTGNTKPRLGIDLAGGTSITLSAKSSDPKAINKANMDVATGIIEQRVNGMGVSEAEVQTQGDRNIIVNIPKGGDKQTAADQVGTTAKLFFRPVLALAPSGVQAPAPSATPSAGATGTPAAAPAATGTGTAAPSAAAGTPSASATKQGRPAGEALAADNTPSPVATTGAAASATPSAAPAAATGTPPAAATPPATPDLSAAMTSGTVPPELAAQFAALDCSKLDQRKNYQGEDGAPTVACTQKDEKGLYYKLALGPVAVQGKNVSKAQASIDTQQGGGWQVQLQFDGKGTDAFTAVTGQLATQPDPTNQFAIVLDGQVVSHPYVRSAIPGGSAVISGNFGQEEAQSLANVLSFGALPLEFQTSDVTTVSPQLGGDQLKAGLVAGLIGMVLVVLYSLLYYRGLGLVSIAGLLVSAALTYSIMSLLGAGIGFALNLPAVCGAIVAIGITADSFIVYFERIRDEVREGALLRPAVQRAWPRARRTILVSDFVSFLCAAVLYVVSVGKVQGFAFTLGLTTALDVVVIFLFTKPLITLLARRKFFSDGHPWSGLDPKRLGARPPLRSTRRRNPSSSAAVKGA